MSSGHRFPPAGNRPAAGTAKSGGLAEMPALIFVNRCRALPAEGEAVLIKPYKHAALSENKGGGKTRG